MVIPRVLWEWGSMMYLLSILTGIVVKLGQLPYVGRFLAGIIFLILDMIAVFSDFSVLIGMPGWIPVVFGVGIAIYLARVVVKGHSKSRRPDVDEHANLPS